jgi:hypothetical protein
VWLPPVMPRNNRRKWLKYKRQQKQTNVQSRLFLCHLESPTTTISTCIFILFFSPMTKKDKNVASGFFFHP